MFPFWYCLCRHPDARPSDENTATKPSWLIIYHEIPTALQPQNVIVQGMEANRRKFTNGANTAKNKHLPSRERVVIFTNGCRPTDQIRIYIPP